MFQLRASRYEEELRQNAERFQEIASQVPGAIFQFLLRTDGSSAVPYASDAIGQLFRMSIDKIKSDATPIFSVIYPDDLLMVVTSIQTSARELTHWDCQFRICFPGGDVRWLHGGSKPRQETNGDVMWFGYISDITERKRDEENLRDKEHFLSTLTDVIPGLLSYWNTDLVCTFASGGYLEWFGKDRHEMSGIHLSELLGADLFKADEQYTEKVLAGEHLHFERTLPSLSGSRNIWVNYIPDLKENRVCGFYVMVTDVSELKQTQRQLSELNEQLTQRIEEAELANRSKSRFLATVAHEFRTPLSLLTSSSDILDRYDERLSSVERAQQLAHIRSAAEQMATLVDSVLTFNRLETTESLNIPSELDVANFCTTLAEEMRLAWCSGHSFSVEIDDSCGSAFLDAQLFRRILENLLSNAFRYTAAPGNVSLRIARIGELLHMTVADSGIGIPAECQEQIFQAFYRGSNVEARRGLGLGLSIVHEALSHLHGTIVVDSNIGTGTIMQVTIPCTRN
jgi:signal transduction histidine kinase